MGISLCRYSKSNFYSNSVFYAHLKYKPIGGAASLAPDCGRANIASLLFFSSTSGLLLTPQIYGYLKPLGFFCL